MIDTQRLLIRPLRGTDASSMNRVWGDAHVMAYCGGAADEARVRLAVDRCIACQEVHGFSPFAVVRRDGGDLIGVCGFKSLPDPQSAELIYHFVAEAWGKGYATEAVLAVLAWARTAATLQYIEASFDPCNTASARILAKAGFRHVEDRWYDDVQQTEPVYRIQLHGETAEVIP